MYIAESRRAIEQGDRIINLALHEIEGVWTGLDKYQEAGVLTRTRRDVETEAIALARRGRVYAKVLRNESLARPLLKAATELAASLAPRSFHGVPWYEECTKALREYPGERLGRGRCARRGARAAGGGALGESAHRLF